ncbi:inositol monophosphatase family protein [Streptomyces sp. CA-210063]|uniref:inositol monophosphatase family protein n=1 Tax=Streptomyces sp. CA-210063 TaxID=2801029 RepID=UPI003FA768C0
MFLLAGCGPWDVAAMVPVVEEAGGRFSDMTGGRALDAGAALFSNGVLHEEVLRCIRRSESSVGDL